MAEVGGGVARAASCAAHARPPGRPPGRGCRPRLSSSTPCPALSLPVTRVCRVERNPATFASNWVPLFAGAADPGSDQARGGLSLQGAGAGGRSKAVRLRPRHPPALPRRAPC